MASIISISTIRTTSFQLKQLNTTQYHDIWCWKSRSCLGTCTNTWRWISSDNGIFLYEIADFFYFYFLSNTNNVNNKN